MTKTTTTQRIIFGVIALFMMISTVVMYISMMMNNGQDQPEYPISQKQQEEQQKLLDEYMKKLNEKTAYLNKLGEALSAQYYETFKAYEKVNQAYNAESIKELTTKDLVAGDGTEVTAGFTDYRAYYIGWLADGTVFDSSFDEGKLRNPLEGSDGLIEGWKEGIVGMKIGGVREIAIPAAKAYGDQASGSIPANSPLKFVIMLIPPMTAEEKANMPQVNL